MTMTFYDLKENLKKEEETILVELLNLTSEDLVDLLEDVIESNQDKLRQYYGENDSSVDR